jgi:hypothetical protein
MARGVVWESAEGATPLDCLVKAIVSVNGQAIAATPYQSSGTSYSQFAVLQTSTTPPTFQVSRRSDAFEDPALPQGYVEPTTRQK